MAIRAKGNKWQVDVTVGGVRAPRVSADTKVEAQRIEADFKAKLLRGVPPEALVLRAAQKKLGEDTLGNLIDAAHAAFWRGRKAERTSHRNALSWADELGEDFPVAAMTADKIGEVCDRWGAKGLAAGTINRKLAAASVLLRLAAERDLIAKVPRLPKRKEYEGRLRYYTDAEVASLLDHVSADTGMRDLFLVAVETGMRQGELLSLIKRDLDLDRKLILLGETKGDKRRSVPITQAATDTLKARVGNLLDHEKVFPTTITTGLISRTIRRWKTKIGLPDADEACFHTFRHTTCSRLVQAGVPIAVVQQFMGHADISTTMRYAHLAPNSLEAARVALEGR